MSRLSTASGEVLTPATRITDDLVRDLIDRGGYTHPLFRPSAAGASPPLPGQAVLLLMGGLVEQSGALDGAAALLELRRVRFLRMVTSGTSLRVRLVPGAETATASGRLLREYVWTALDHDDEVVAEAEALMLMGQGEGEDG